MAGHYEVRRVTRLGVPLAEIAWITPGEPPTTLVAVAPERIELLAEALEKYLARDARKPPE